MKTFVQEMQDRGLVAQITHEAELNEHLTEKQIAYSGFDPTASSLHVGHLMPIMTLARWQRAGHKALVLMGGGTALIGDPTGKTSQRKMLDEEEIDSNIASFKRQVAGILNLADKSVGEIVNNADWLRPLQYLPFLREIGSQFSVNRMLTAECFKSRLESGLSFLEFNYMLLQSYDFLHLHRTHKCTVQLGGDDQWSNMLAGVDLVRRLDRGRAYCMTVPLLTTSSGAKMGKTENGAVWLDPNLLSPFEYFQYWRNFPDDMVGKGLRYFTFLEMDEVRELESLQGQQINEAKIKLAYEATKIMHGEEEAEKAKQQASTLFKGAGADESADAPEVLVDGGALAEEVGIVDLMLLAKVVPSKGEGRRLVEQGGVVVDGVKISSVKDTIAKQRLAASDGILLKKGKKHYYRLKIS